MVRRARTPTDGDAPARPRALFRGTLAFGLVGIPISVHRAVRRRSLPFHDLHDQDGGRILRRAVCSVDGAPVSRAHVVKGVEIEPGRWVRVSGAELQALAPSASRSIEILEFVDPHEIDPIFYERTYWLVPGADADRAYALLAAAMNGLRRVGIARFTMRGRQHLAAIRPVTRDTGGSVLALSTLGYADEILPLAELPGLASLAAVPEDRELHLAERLVESLSGHFRPERYHDDYRGRVLAYLRSKAEGTALPASPEPAPAQVPADLPGALEQSLAEAERRHAA